MLDLTDPAFWTRADAYPLLATMRRNGPVQPHDSPTEGPLWAVLSHAGATAVLNDVERFSSEGGSLLGTGHAGAVAGAGQMMALTDPPRHRVFRDPVMRFFGARRATQLEPYIHRLTEEVVDRALAKEHVDIVQDIGAIVPLTVMCELMGIPMEDREEVVALCDQAFLGREPAERRTAHRRLVPYLFQLALARRTDPRDDVVSALATAEFGGQPLPLEQAVLNCDNIIVGGIQTVRHTAAMALWTLHEHPEAWQALRDGVPSLERATEELLRFTSVGLHVLRTARVDVELCGQPIRAGDRVVVWTPAANRDESVFPEPDLLDLNRHPNRHIAFGFGPHYCIGAPLARVELRALFDALRQRVAGLEVTGPLVWNRSIINFGLDEFPVRLRAARPIAGESQR